MDIRAYIEERSIPVPFAGCWIWLGELNWKGYGQVRLPEPGRSRPRWSRAHRLAYQAYKGAIPDKTIVRHSCDVRCCVNPDHLSPGTPLTNTADMMRRGRQRGGIHKLTDLDVDQILRATDANVETHRAIAARFGISTSRVWQISKTRSKRAPWREFGDEGVT